MDWSQMSILITACVISAGGIGGIVIAVIKFSSDMIAERLSTKYKNDLEKSMEKYKSELSKKMYISKAKFDKEFEIYQSVSSNTIETVFGLSDILSALNRDLPFQDLINIKNATIGKYNEVKKSLIKFAPFIDKKIYDCYDDILALLDQALNLCQYYIVANENASSDFSFNIQGNIKRFTMCEAREEISKLYLQICTQSDLVLDNLRNFLSSRDVLD